MTPSPFDLTGRTAVVVGGTTGIGRAIALGLADAGADVVATGRHQKTVDEVSAAIERRGRRTLRHPADVGDSASLASLRDACLNAFGTVDIVVAAAGITKRTPTIDLDEAEWNRILDTNVTGMFRTYQAFAPSMIARGSGRLIGILAVEWAPHGITVNAIAPGVFETDLNRELLKGARGAEFKTRTPMGRFGRIEELAGTAVYLASDATSFVTGQLIAVDGGFLASGVNQ